MILIAFGRDSSRRKEMQLHRLPIEERGALIRRHVYSQIIVPIDYWMLVTGAI
jgi:hypothetical protein